MDDPVKWLNMVVAKACGELLDLTVTEVFDAPQALVCMDEKFPASRGVTGITWGDS